ncbi:MAG: DNA cytosine methyltransferase [Myxococcales bacterium]|nr:DNA cytosine methyltransferase [Myxococcales bacterium]
MNSSPQRTKIECVDLFCGAGGLTRGLIDSGISVVAGIDTDPACAHPYAENHPGVAFHQRDVTTLRADELRRWYGPKSVRVLAGCAPCQPFSTYSNRYATVGTQRWRLLYQFGRLVDESSPDIVTMENVPTVVRHSIFHEFVKTLQNSGYHVWHSVVDCADYGLPQRRRRTVLLASRFGPVELRPSREVKRRTVDDVLRSLPPVRHGSASKDDPLHAAATLSPLNLARINASKPGGSWREWPAHLVAECHRRTTGSKYPSVYGRMKPDEPAPTLTTQFYGFGSGRFGHPRQARALSLREGAILQGFPVDYSFLPSGGRVHFKILGRLIGNAVPVDLGRAIGEAIVEHVQAHLGGTSGSSVRRARVKQKPKRVHA